MDEIRPREEPRHVVVCWAGSCTGVEEFFQSARSKKIGRKAFQGEVSLMWGQRSPHSPDVIVDTSLGINPDIFSWHLQRIPLQESEARAFYDQKWHKQLESLVRSAVLLCNASWMQAVAWLNAKVKQVGCLLDATRHLKPGVHLFCCPSLWLLLVRLNMSQ